MKSMKQLVLIAIFAVFAMGSVQAAELKVGFVNVARLLEKAPQAAKAKVELEKEFSPRNNRLIADQKDIKSLEEKLIRDGAVMSETERRNLERDIISKKRDIKRAQDEFREDFNLRRNEELTKLQRLVFEAIKGLAVSDKYDLVLHDGVVYASNAVDITESVQARLDKMGSGK